MRVDLATCLLGMALLASHQNHRLSEPMTTRIAQGICSASARYHLDPGILAAYALKENAPFKLDEVKPAAVGYDVGLWGVNTHYQGREPLLRYALDPVVGADIAARIVRNNLRHFGYTWQGIAAYWSPRAAERKTYESMRYFVIWKEQYEKAQSYLAVAEKRVASWAKSSSSQP